MIGLERIIGRINADSAAECERLLQEAKRKAEAVRKKDGQYRELLAAQERAKLEQRLRQTQQSRRDLMRMEQRGAVLQAKQRMVAEAFQNAQQALETLDKQRKAKLYMALLTSAAEPEKPGEVLLQKADRKTVGAAISEAFPFLQIAKEECPAAGFILRYGAVEIDCTLPTILEDLRRTLSAEVAALLFDREDAHGEQ